MERIDILREPEIHLKGEQKKVYCLPSNGPVLICDGDAKMSEQLARIVNGPTRRGQWHTARDLYFEMWQDGGNCDKCKPFHDRLKKIMAIELPKEDFEKVIRAQYPRLVVVDGRCCHQGLSVHLLYVPLLQQQPCGQLPQQQPYGRLQQPLVSQPLPPIAFFYAFDSLPLLALASLEARVPETQPAPT